MMGMIPDVGPEKEITMQRGTLGFCAVPTPRRGLADLRHNRCCRRPAAPAGSKVIKTQLLTFEFKGTSLPDRPETETGMRMRKCDGRAGNRKHALVSLTEKCTSRDLAVLTALL